MDILAASAANTDNFSFNIKSTINFDHNICDINGHSVFVSLVHFIFFLAVTSQGLTLTHFLHLITKNWILN